MDTTEKAQALITSFLAGKRMPLHECYLRACEYLALSSILIMPVSNPAFHAAVVYCRMAEKDVEKLYDQYFCN